MRCGFAVMVNANWSTRISKFLDRLLEELPQDLSPIPKPVEREDDDEETE